MWLTFFVLINLKLGDNILEGKGWKNDKNR